MNPFKNLFGKKKLDDFGQYLGHALPAVYTQGTLDHWDNNSYENGYSSIRAISNRFMVLKPYAIDNNGEKLKDVAAINALARPNKDMSGVDFRDGLAVFTLVHSKTYVLVWEKFGNQARPASENLNPDKIAGYTILEGISEVMVGNKLHYEVYQYGQKVTYYPYQVMVFKGINPYNLSEGYSSSRAAKRWTTLDDYVADYERGFFENGAVPQGQFIITAPSAKEYKDIVEKMKERHRGAGKNNNVMYAYAPLDPNTGKATNATVQWVPFNQSNKDLDLKNIFEQANNKIDSVYGVAAFIRSIGDAPNFATAQVIERNFVENTVRPFAIKFWTRFSHELNRITNGTGFGIAFDLETPNIAEEKKADAETAKIWVDTILTLKDAGATLDSAIDALKLSPNWKLLEFAESPSTETEIDNDKPEVDNGGEVNGSPDTETTKGHKAISDPKAEEKIKGIAELFLNNQIDRAVNTLTKEDIGAKVIPDYTDKELDQFVEEMTLVFVTLLKKYGPDGFYDGTNILETAGLAPDALVGYQVRPEYAATYKEYVRNVGRSYGLDTKKAIQAILREADASELTLADTRSKLNMLKQTQGFRAERLARTETNRSSEYAQLDGINQVEEQSGYKLNKVWNVSGSEPCEYCRALEGKTVGVTEVFVPLGSDFIGQDGGVRKNDFTNVDVSSAHPNCNCFLTYEVADAPVTNKAGKDPNGIYAANGRYLGKKLGNGLVSIKNPTSKEETVVRL